MTSQIDPSERPENEEVELIERVDSGLYGSVYRAKQKPLGRQVAVKFIKMKLKPRTHWRMPRL